MSGQAQSDVATASDRKDAVRKAFNQEYLATQQAMAQAAERARAQVLDQKQIISNHAETVKSGAQPPQPPVGRPPSGQTHPHPQAAQQGAPHMTSNTNRHNGDQIMFEIANEIRNIIAQEIDLRMQALSDKVETALAEAFPPRNSTTDQNARPSNSAPQPKTSGKKT
jgi:hypothetical protein